jgi:hypothetical protein
VSAIGCVRKARPARQAEPRPLRGAPLPLLGHDWPGRPLPLDPIACPSVVAFFTPSLTFLWSRLDDHSFTAVELASGRARFSSPGGSCNRPGSDGGRLRRASTERARFRGRAGRPLASARPRPSDRAAWLADAVRPHGGRHARRPTGSRGGPAAAAGEPRATRGIVLLQGHPVLANVDDQHRLSRLSSDPS